MPRDNRGMRRRTAAHEDILARRCADAIPCGDEMTAEEVATAAGIRRVQDAQKGLRGAVARGMVVRTPHGSKPSTYSRVGGVS